MTALSTPLPRTREHMVAASLLWWQPLRDIEDDPRTGVVEHHQDQQHRGVS